MTGELLDIQESVAWCCTVGAGAVMTGAVMTKVTVFDLNPVLVSMMLMVAVPAAATSAGATVATASVELTIRVGSWPAFHSTTQVAEKFAPVTVRSKPALPAAVLAGDKLPLSWGAGLLEGAGLLAGTALFETVQPVKQRSNNEQIQNQPFFTVVPGCPPGEGLKAVAFAHRTSD